MKYQVIIIREDLYKWLEHIKTTKSITSFSKAVEFLLTSNPDPSLRPSVFNFELDTESTNFESEVMSLLKNICEKEESTSDYVFSIFNLNQVQGEKLLANLRKKGLINVRRDLKDKSLLYISLPE